MCFTTKQIQTCDRHQQQREVWRQPMGCSATGNLHWMYGGPAPPTCSSMTLCHYGNRPRLWKAPKGYKPRHTHLLQHEAAPACTRLDVVLRLCLYLMQLQAGRQAAADIKLLVDTQAHRRSMPTTQHNWGFGGFRVSRLTTHTQPAEPQHNRPCQFCSFTLLHSVQSPNCHGLVCTPNAKTDRKPPIIRTLTFSAFSRHSSCWSAAIRPQMRL